ncbi:MAG: ribosome maturation factor RimP [Acidobacteriota bacterium]|nr:ribosome maturation factor RimP [Acidobacteriota bacterium]
MAQTTGSPARPRQMISPEIEAEIGQVAVAAGCELLHAEWKGGVLRLMIDRSEGVSLGDCEHVSKQVSALLDVLDFGKGRYVLEVSSPGLDRPLFGPRDYQRFTGSLARVTFTDPETRAKRTVVGRLEGLTVPGNPESPESPENNSAVALVETTGRRHLIGLGSIRQARLEIEL